MSSTTLGLRARFSKLLGQMFGGKRDLYDVFGYQDDLRAEDYYAMYARGGIAQRIIRAFPQATWRDMPMVKAESETFSEEFEQFYKDQKLANYLERADRLSTIGHFGLLYMGFSDVQSDTGHSIPLQVGEQPDLLYFSPYGEYNINVASWDMNPQSERYGLPQTYTLQTGSPLAGERRTPKSITAHHSRCIHIAELLDDDETYGTPRLQAVFNRLQDKEKVVGGGAETYWLAANRGMGFTADADADIEDPEALKEEMEDYVHGLKRWVALQGGELKSLGSDIADPSKTFSTLIDEISGTTGIPKRILLGNEAGELASSQDENNWLSRIDERRETFAAPMIMRPLIDTMIETGNLPDPGDYEVYWEESDALSEEDIANILDKKASAIDKLDRAGAISDEEKIRTLHPDWTDEKIQDELSKIEPQTELP